MSNFLSHLTAAILTTALAVPTFAAPVNQTLPPGVAKSLAANKIESDALSVVMLPLNGDDTPTFVNADVSVNPASTMKLVTTYAALELLGPNHQWKTEFHGDGPLIDGTLNGNLYLKGGGDPKLNMEKLWLLLRELRANGVRTVSGDLILDRSHFIQPALPIFDDDGGDKNKPYLVGPDSLLINLKALRFAVRNDSGKIGISVEPPIANVRIDNRVQALPSGKCPAWPDIRYSPVPDGDGVKVTVTGKLAAGCSGQTYLSLLDHPTYAAGTVRAIWKELGGKILGKDRVAEVPEDARLLARSYSPDLAEIIRDINKYSNNTMARQLFLSLGAEFRNEGRWRRCQGRTTRHPPVAGEKRPDFTAPGNGERLGPFASRTRQCARAGQPASGRVEKPLRRGVHFLDAPGGGRRNHAQAPAQHPGRRQGTYQDRHPEYRSRHCWLQPRR